MPCDENALPRGQVAVELGAHPLRVRADVSTQIRVKPTRALIDEVEELVGAGAVELK